MAIGIADPDPAIGRAGRRTHLPHTGAGERFRDGLHLVAGRALFRVWLRTTSHDDDAILIVKVGRFPPDGAVRLMRDLDAIERAIGKTRRQSAPMLFTDRILSDEEMPRLFAAATHYWSMSHGEGWDQPMVEAGATGLRLIAPMHTAYEAYLDSSVASMIPARLVPAQTDGVDGVGPLFEGSQ